MAAGTLEKVSIIPEDQSGAIISMIERAARDPAVDIDKMQRLLDMRNSERREEAERAYNASMVAAQTDMRPVATDANNPQTRSKYASYLALDNAMRPIYTKHGFALSFDTSDGAPEGHVRVVCDVMHSAGMTRARHIDMPADGKGAKGGDVMTKTHATGAAVTYGQRYLLKMIFNIAVGEDKDGNAPRDDGSTVTADQIGDLVSLIESVGADKTKFLQYMKVGTLADIPASQFKRACEALNAKRAKS